MGRRSRGITRTLDRCVDVVVGSRDVVLALAALVAALRWQFRTPQYVAYRYWFAVAMVATFGTMAADALHQFTGAPYWLTTGFYALVLGLVFWRWRADEGTLSIHSITTRSREKYYWATVLATFALGTAAGDWTAGDLRLNYLPSGLLFGVVILIPLAGYLLSANAIGMFWFAYVVTRPLGASFADYLDSPQQRHGAGIPHPMVWGPLAVVMVALVIVSARARRPVTAQDAVPAAA